jgi:hypothetical protein
MPKTVRISIPISLRQPFDKVEDVNLKNEFTMVFHNLKLYKHFNNGLPHIKRAFDHYKASPEPYLIEYTTWIASKLVPFGLNRYLNY